MPVYNGLPRQKRNLPVYLRASQSVGKTASGRTGRKKQAKGDRLRIHRACRENQRQGKQTK